MHPEWELVQDEANEFTITNSEPIDATGEQLKKLDLYSILIIFHRKSGLKPRFERYKSESFWPH